MATKNLARTVIEVGRSTRSKDDRKRLRRMERLEAAEYCREAVGIANLGVIDSEYDDDYNSRPIEALDELDTAPVDKAGYIEQLDKLGPAMRWMESRCGRKWADVFSELSQKFRNKGIALSHVVDTHMLDWVQDGTKPDHYRWSAYEFIVDENGILRKNVEARRWRGNNKTRRTNYSYDDYKKQRPMMEKWAGNRKIITRGEHFYWAFPVNVCRVWSIMPDGTKRVHCETCHENNKSVDDVRVRYGSRWWAIRWYWMRERQHCPRLRYRQDVPLSQEDHDIYNSLLPTLKKELIVKTLES